MQRCGTRPRHAFTTADGYSLVELMVALVIGLILTLSMVTLMMNTSRTHADLNQTGMQVENGRAAAALLTSRIQLAGFYAEFGDPLPAPTGFHDPCYTHLPVQREALALPVQGYDGVTGTIPNCVTSAGHVPGTDVLVVRRAATTATPMSALDPDTVYLQGSPREIRLDKGYAGNFPLTDRNGVSLPVRRFRIDIYFVGRESADAPPALRRLELDNHGFRADTLVDGVENLQIDYGIDRNGDGAPNASASTNTDAYVGIPTTLDQWQNVVSVRVHLLARNLEPTVGHTDGKTYRLGLTATNAAQDLGPLNDAYKRHVYQNSVRLVNIAGRRE